MIYDIRYPPQFIIPSDKSTSHYRSTGSLAVAIIALLNPSSVVQASLAAAGVDAKNVLRLGIPDRFIEHGERGELFTDLGLDVAGICNSVRQALEKGTVTFSRKAFAN